MRTLLVVTTQSSIASALSSMLDAAHFQIILKEDIADAEFLLSRGAIDASILDLDLTDARSTRAIQDLKRFAPGCPIIVYASTKQWEWEEDAYLQGVQHVLTKPIRGKLLQSLLGRLFPTTEEKPVAVVADLDQGEGFRARAQPHSSRSLEALRRFSTLLTHGLDCNNLLKQFLLILREVIGVNRAIIFLRKPAALLTSNPLSPEDRWLRSTCAIGLDPTVLDHFALSLGAGIGGYLHRQGRILQANSHEAQASREISKEFQILGTQLAIPILDRQSLIGVAVFDQRLTGEPYGNEELAMLFHLLEEVGLAVRNAWIHAQMAANHSMVTDILSRLGSGCVVISSSLVVLHANKAADRLMLGDRAGKAEMEFNDLPQQLGSMVFTVIKTGVGLSPTKYEFVHLPDQKFRVAIAPFTTSGSTHTDAALLTIEDVTEHERAVLLELETSNLRMIKGMAEHLAHEIGNALVPISTHQQLLREAANDPELQESLGEALAGGVKRISRLSSQMNFLAREWNGDFLDSFQISDLIVEAFHEAHTFHPGKKVAQLSFNRSVAPWKVAGDAKALRHAFAEVMLNALQANPESPTIAVDLRAGEHGLHELYIEVRDSGSGFTSEAVRRASEPFYSTRNVGLGIGLTVTRKIIESHHGRLEIPPNLSGNSGVVRIALPFQL
ncbi:MAG TPA: ATP-binding protein [Chthoniobacteraceae bacterium]|jgi:nitrogen-specific signal transduction histidine kinase/DNA-binding NarL/FixJ family response regulator|nr:ATP-binding protein [Chthoniobacteraceae bacterium]